MIKHHLRRWVAVVGTAVLALAGFAALTPSASAATGQLGGITSAHRDGNIYVFDAGAARLRVTVEQADLWRLEVAPDGTFTDPANTKPTDPSAPAANIVVKSDYTGATSQLAESSTAYQISTADAELTITKSPATLSMKRADGTLLW